MKLIIIIFLLLASFDIHAQDLDSHSKQERKKLTRKEKKLQREEEAIKYFEQVHHLIEARTFVLASKSDSIPWILVDSAYGARGGFSMIEGTVTDYKYDFNEKKKSYSLSFTFKSPFNTRSYLIYSIPGNATATNCSTSDSFHSLSRAHLHNAGSGGGGLLLHPSQIPSHHYKFYFHFIDRPQNKE